MQVSIKYYGVCAGSGSGGVSELLKVLHYCSLCNGGKALSGELSCRLTGLARKFTL